MRAKPIALTAEEKDILERLLRSSTAEQRQAFRARLILLAAAGWLSKAIAKELRCREATVSKWRGRFVRQRLAGLSDAPRPGKKGLYTAETATS